MYEVVIRVQTGPVTTDPPRRASRLISIRPQDQCLRRQRRGRVRRRVAGVDGCGDRRAPAPRRTGTIRSDRSPILPSRPWSRTRAVAGLRWSTHSSGGARSTGPGACSPIRAAEEGWTDEMQDEAKREATRFEEEVARAEPASTALDDPDHSPGLPMMNRSLPALRSRGRYDRVATVPDRLTCSPSCRASCRSDDERRRSSTPLVRNRRRQDRDLSRRHRLQLLHRQVARQAPRHHAPGAVSRSGCCRSSRRSGSRTRLPVPSLPGSERCRTGDPFALGFLVGGPPDGNTQPDPRRRVRQRDENAGHLASPRATRCCSIARSASPTS